MRKVLYPLAIALAITAMACATINRALCNLGATSYCTAAPSATPTP
jgi:hypothetical protein